MNEHDFPELRDIYWSQLEIFEFMEKIAIWLGTDEPERLKILVPTKLSKENAE